MPAARGERARRSSALPPEGPRGPQSQSNRREGARVDGFPVTPSSVDLRVTGSQNIRGGVCVEGSRSVKIFLILHPQCIKLLKGRFSRSELLT